MKKLDEFHIEVLVIQQNHQQEKDIEFLNKQNLCNNIIIIHLPLTSGLFNTSPIASLIFSTVG
jgi:hypothetical protein